MFHSMNMLSLTQPKVATRSERVIGPLTAQTAGTAAGLVDATNIPPPTVEVLVDPGAEAGRAHGERHQMMPGL